MHGVEPGAFEVDEAPEAHPLALGGGGFLDGDEVADDGDDLSDAVGEVAGEHAATDDGFGVFGQQQEGGTEGESQQFPFVEGVRQRRGVERRQDIGGRLGRGEEFAGTCTGAGGKRAPSGQKFRHVGGTGAGPACVGCALGFGGEQKMGFPQEHVFGGAGEPKGANADQDGELFEGRSDALDEVDQGGEGTSFGSGLFEGGDGGVVEVLDEVEAEGEGLGCGVGDGQGAHGVDARSLDAGAEHAGFMHVEFGPVESPEVVDAGAHVLDGEVDLEEQALVALDRIRGGVALGEGVAGEAFHLAPHLADHVGRVAFRHGLGVEGVAGTVELLPRPKLPAHAAPQHVGLSEIEAREPVRHLDHVLLVHHDPVRLGHEVEQNGMGVGAFGRVAVPFDVRLHHPASGHPRPNHRARRHQPQVVVDLQFAHEHPHGGRLHVEAPGGAGLSKHGAHALVRLEPPHVVDVNRCGGFWIPGAHHLQRVLDFAEPALAQDVKLVQPHILGDHHVKHDRRKSLGRHEQRPVPMDVVMGDEHPTRMQGQAAGEVANHCRVLQHHSFHLAQPAGVELAGAEGVDFVFGQPHDLAQLPHGCAVLKGIVGGEQRHVGEALEHVRHHVVAVRPREVDVKVGRVGPVEVEEALEVEVEFNRIDVGDAQQVCDEAVGAAAASHMKIPLASGVARDVPVDEEVGQESLLSDQANLVFHPLQHGVVVVRIAVGQTLGTQRPHQRLVLVFTFRVGVRVVVQASLGGLGQVHRAPGQEVFGPRHQFRHLGVRFPQFVRGTKTVSRVATFRGIEAAQERVVVDGPQQPVRVPIPFAGERGGRQRQEPRPQRGIAIGPREAHRRHFPGLDPHPFVRAEGRCFVMIVQAPVARRAPRGPGVDCRHAGGADGLGQSRGKGCSGQIQFRIPSAQGFVPGGVPGQGHKPPRVAVPHIDAERRRHPKPFRPPHKIPVRGRRPHVRQRHSRHATGLGPRQHVVDGQDAVAQAESAVGVQVHGSGKGRGTTGENGQSNNEPWRPHVLRCGSAAKSEGGVAPRDVSEASAARRLRDCDSFIPNTSRVE